MEDAKLQALHDSLAKLRGGQKKGLGRNSSSSGPYSWSHSNPTTTQQEEEDDLHPHGLPNNPLYAYFAPEGTYDNKTKLQQQQSHGDGRYIKRTFDDIDNAQVDDSDSDSDQDSSDSDKKKLSKQDRKAQKKAAAKEAKRLAKLQAKLLEKKMRKQQKQDSDAQNVDAIVHDSLEEKTSNNRSSKQKKKKRKSSRKSAPDDSESVDNDNTQPATVTKKRRLDETKITDDPPFAKQSKSKRLKDERKSDKERALPVKETVATNAGSVSARPVVDSFTIPALDESLNKSKKKKDQKEKKKCVKTGSSLDKSVSKPPDLETTGKKQRKAKLKEEALALETDQPAGEPTSSSADCVAKEKKEKKAKKAQKLKISK
jgi:hypothetical protein